MKIAIVIYATNDETSKIYRALSSAQEFIESGDDTLVIFDGSGAETLNKISKKEHQLNGFYTNLKSNIEGACSVCAKSYNVKNELVEEGIKMLEDHKGHVSLRKYIVDGY